MKTLPRTYLVLCILAVSGGRVRAGQEDAPTMSKWTDSTGKYSVMATFAGMKEGQVCLKKENGQVISVPPARRSVADREFIKRLL